MPISTYNQIRLQASDAEPDDYFGNSVALSSDGNTLAVGAVWGNNTGGTDAGSVYIFTRTGSTWTEQTRLQASDAAAYDYFGNSVALSADGNTLAVGAFFDNNSGGTSVGSVYIFTRDGSTWKEQIRLQSSDAEVGDQFGNSVALSADGNTLAVGACRDDNSGGIDAGSVYIFTRIGGTWTEHALLQASNATAYDYFGWSVALSSDGNTLAAGAHLSAIIDNNAGAVFIFTRTGSTWTEQTRLQSRDIESNDLFGWSVALSSDGNTLAVGAYRDDNSGGADAGSVYIFTRIGGTWTEQTKLCASDAEPDDYFGNSVALSSDGNILAVGAYCDDSSGSIDAGSAYIFTRTGSTWTEQTKLCASDAAPGDEFGWSIALSSDGNIFAVGARLDDNDGGTEAGSVYIFNRDGSLPDA